MLNFFTSLFYNLVKFHCFYFDSGWWYFHASVFCINGLVSEDSLRCLCFSFFASHIKCIFFRIFHLVFLIFFIVLLIYFIAKSCMSVLNADLEVKFYIMMVCKRLSDSQPGVPSTTPGDANFSFSFLINLYICFIWLLLISHVTIL